MRLRKIVLSLFACLALGAFAANAAQAGQWTAGTTENQTSGGTKITSETITCEKHGKTKIILHLTILGQPVTITATAGHCVNATIDTTVLGVVHISTKLQFTLPTVEPATCSVAGGTLTTNALTGEVIMDATSGSTVVFGKLFPETGTTLATIKLEGSECPFAGVEAPLSGTACGELVHTNAAGTGFEPNKTGTLTKVQTLLFGESQQTTGGCALTVGKSAAQLTLSLSITPSGVIIGKPFGAD
jgi:hypothetical protein